MSASSKGAQWNDVVMVSITDIGWPANSAGSSQVEGSVANGFGSTRRRAAARIWTPYESKLAKYVGFAHMHLGNVNWDNDLPPFPNISKRALTLSQDLSEAMSVINEMAYQVPYVSQLRQALLSFLTNTCIFW